MDSRTPCGAVVKYNPCTSYARGSACPYFDRSRKCQKSPLTCEMPEYDKWYKDVLKGKTKYFHPIRMKLLEKPDTYLFLFHVDHHAIVGEAQITRATVENGMSLYWFDSFIAYPYPVPLELLEADSRLPWVAKRSRTRCIYIDGKSIEEIRRLSRLADSERLKEGKDLRQVLQQMRKRSRNIPKSGSHKSLDLSSECQRLRNLGINNRVLTETEKYYSLFTRKKQCPARSQYETFYASLYLAFRMLRIPKLSSEIGVTSGVNSRKLQKIYLLIVRELELSVPPLDPEELIKCQSVKLRISDETVQRAISIIHEIRNKKHLGGKSPSVLAAAAIFMAGQEKNENRGLKKIAEAFGVSIEAIRYTC